MTFKNRLREYTLFPLIPNAMSGILTSLNSIILCFSYATIIFSGYLAQYLPVGANILIFSVLLFSLFNSLFGKHRFLSLGLSPLVMVLFAVMATNISSSLSAINQPAQMLPTVLAAFMITTIAVGVTFFSLSILKSGNLIRYMPYVVVSGFKVGLGCMMLFAVFKNVLSNTNFINIHSASLNYDYFSFLATVIFGVLLLIIQRRYKNPLYFPSILLGGTLVFYLILFLLNISIKTAIQQHWLYGSFPSGQFHAALWLSNLGNVNMTALISQVDMMILIIFIASINVLLNMITIERSNNKDMDVNTELNTLGVTTMIGGMAGCVPVFPVLSAANIRNILKSDSASVGLMNALFCGIILMYGTGLISYIPIFVTNGILICISLTFIIEELYDGWFRLLKKDYLILIGVLLAIAWLGLIKGVIFGIAISAVLFIVDYSHSKIIRFSLSGKKLHSSLFRDRAATAILQSHGDSIVYLKLQGYLFFGTAYNLIHHIDELVSSSKGMVKFIILDFTHIEGIDSSIIFHVEKMKRLASKNKILFVFSNISAFILPQLKKMKVISTLGDNFIVFSTYDAALEWCENKLINENLLTQHPQNFLDQLSSIVSNASLAKELLPYFEQMKIPGGEYVFHQGNANDSFYFIESGELSVLLTTDNHRVTQLCKLTQGNIFGETFFSNELQTVSILANQPSVLQKLSKDSFHILEKNQPELADVVIKLIVSSLSNRLRYANNQIEILLR